MKRIRLALLFLSCLTPMLMSGQAPSVACTRSDIQVVQNLYFGGLVVNPSGGSVTLTEDGALITDGSGVLPGAKPPAMEARFRLTGPPGALFSLRVDPQFPILNSPGGGSVRITEFRGSFPNFQGRFDATGQAEFRLGARLDISANTAPALFTATQAKLQLNVAGSPATGTINKSFTISALLRAPLRLTNLGPLEFGTLLAGSQPGEFEVLPDGSFRSLGANGPTFVRGVPRPAAFSLQGPSGTCYNIRLPQQITLVGPGSGVQVLGFTCDLPLNGILPSGGTAFRVGGRVRIGPAQAYGQYRGTMMVEVFYQ
jgi:hypothetical protein